jgi:hypothetical protein
MNLASPRVAAADRPSRLAILRDLVRRRLSQVPVPLGRAHPSRLWFWSVVADSTKPSPPISRARA